MFDLDMFISDCEAAMAEGQPLPAVKEVLTRAVSDQAAVAAALPPERAGIVPLHVTDELSVLHVVWAPGMRIWPHDHLMWAAIGLFGGQEDNTLYRRGDGAITESGGMQLTEGDVALLGDDTIHAVHNPLRRYTGAIHVYGGDITSQPGRSEWDTETMAQTPYDFDRARQHFANANAALS